MPVHISLLRAVNVGGRSIKMADLRDLYQSLDFDNTQTLLQSGNAVFIADEDDPRILAEQIEAAIKGRYGFHSDIIMRSPAQMRQVVAGNPFSPDRDLNPSRLAVTFYKGELDADSIAAVESLIQEYTGPEEVHLFSREVYIYYPDGMGRSKLAEVFGRLKLSHAATTRNWNTVTKLLALAEKLEAG